MSKNFQLAQTFLYVRKFLSVIIVVLAIACLLLMPKALAHSPLTPGDNESLSTATLVPDPTKSWAIYGELHEGEEAQYYRFNITERQRIHIMLFKSTNPEDKDFLPRLVLMSPSINTQGVVPEYVEVPSEANTVVVEGKQPAQATYEPFSPSTFHLLADLDLDASTSGTYYIAVYESYRGGHYGLAIGDWESYTLTEWILIPINLIFVYQWEGQSLAFIFVPMIATLAIGIVLIILQQRRKAARRTLFCWLGSLAGLLFIGTGATMFVQMFVSLNQAPLTPEVLITLILALIPILLGIAALRLYLKPERKTNLRMRLYLIVLGVVALFAWAGLLVGPTLAIIASVLPSQLANREF